jgi:hypothetical protein
VKPRPFKMISIHHEHPKQVHARLRHLPAKLPQSILHCLLAHEHACAKLSRSTYAATWDRPTQPRAKARSGIVHALDTKEALRRCGLLLNPSPLLSSPPPSEAQQQSPEHINETSLKAHLPLLSHLQQYRCLLYHPYITPIKAANSG